MKTRARKEKRKTIFNYTVDFIKLTIKSGSTAVKIKVASYDFILTLLLFLGSGVCIVSIQTCCFIKHYHTIHN